MGKAVLFKRFLQHPTQVGALCPSSCALCRAMASEIGVENAGLVVELGPGTGVITRELVRRLPENGKLLAVMNVPVSAPRTIGTELSFRFAGHPDVVKGKVFEVSPRADHRSGTIEIKALIDNADHILTAGMSGVLQEISKDAGE